MYTLTYIHLKPPIGSFLQIAHPYKLLASRYCENFDANILLKLFMYLLFAVAYLCTACDMPPLVPFSNINNMSTSVNYSNFTFINFNKGVHARPGTDKK